MTRRNFDEDDESKWQEAYNNAQSYFERDSTIQAEEFTRKFSRTYKEGSDWKELAHGLILLNKSRSQKEKKELTAAIFCMAPCWIDKAFIQLFLECLRRRQLEWERMREDDSMIVESSVVDFDEGAVYESLCELGWLEGKLRRPLKESLEEFILCSVRDEIEGNFEDEGLLQSVVEWKDAVVSRWIRDLVGPENATKWEKLCEEATQATLESFCEIRISEIFDVVAEFPDSVAAVKELRVALEKTKMYRRLAKELRSKLEKRLIHPGANTSQIIEVYISTIKVLRIIDPSDSLLDAVALPVRSYLRNRNDTVRCIITSLTDETGGGDLYQELRRQDASPLEHAQLDSDDEGNVPDLHWQPPSNTTHTFSSFHQNSPSSSSARPRWDILSMLVSIYGSKELFVNEYRVMLADKLLNNLTYNTDKEIRNLELLKLRFGEPSMRYCEVMIKDMDDSRRIITNIHSTIDNQRAETPRVDAAILSHIFWPPLQKEHFKVHPRIQQRLDQFSIEYAKLKNPRRLLWLPQLGTVHLELEVEEQDPTTGQICTTLKEFQCSPIHATLIHHFEDRTRWTALQLSNETGLTEATIRKKMMFWVHNGAVRIVKPLSSPKNTDAIPDIGETLYELSSILDARTATATLEDDGDTATSTNVGAQEAEEMQIYESYIIGMLSNLGQLPLERIHNMLKMFVTSADHLYDKSLHQLGALLQRMSMEDKIEAVGDGQYRIRGK